MPGIRRDLAIGPGQARLREGRGAVGWMAEEMFQKGRMYWRKDNDNIYALFNGGGWAAYANIWREGDPQETL